MWEREGESLEQDVHTCMTVHVIKHTLVASHMVVALWLEHQTSRMKIVGSNPVQSSSAYFHGKWMTA